MQRNLSILPRLFVLAGLLGISTMHQAAAQDVPTPFVVTVPVNVNNFVLTPIAIPHGMRLVIDYVSLSGAAASASGPIQPIVILYPQLENGPQNLFYFQPTPSATVSGQYSMSEKTVIFADSLGVAPAFSGYTPSFLSFNVVISGHLIELPSQPMGPIMGPLPRPIVIPGIVAPVYGSSGGTFKR